MEKTNILNTNKVFSNNPDIANTEISELITVSGFCGFHLIESHLKNVTELLTAINSYGNLIEVTLHDLRPTKNKVRFISLRICEFYIQNTTID